jgi:hypothetical protein
MATNTNAFTYARARLWLGISGVGFWVLLACTWLANAYWLAPLLSGFSAWSGLVLFLGGYGVLSAPFDWLGGWVLPRRFHRTTMGAGAYALHWVRGIMVHGLILGLGALLWLNLSTLMAGLPLAVGTGATVLVVAGFNGLQMVFQPQLARLVASFQVTHPSTASHQPVWQCNDPGFTGGLILPRQQAILPHLWQTTLPPQQLAAVQQRRAVLRSSGAWRNGMIKAVGWNVLCAGATYWALASLPGVTANTSAGPLPFWLTVASLSTLGAFVGLLILPTPSQQGTLQADRLAWASQATSCLEALLRQLDRFQDEEPTRGRWLQRIFHPVASVSQRLASLQSGGASTTASGDYHLARHALYLSWPTLSLLSRAVHCNSGRPWLWVFLPADG